MFWTFVEHKQLFRNYYERNINSGKNDEKTPLFE